jgi:chromosome segregation ATPase
MAKYSGLVGAAQVTIDQAQARSEERVVLPITWAVALNDYATALRKEQERTAAEARQVGDVVTIAQLEAKVKALTALLEDSKEALAFFAENAITALGKVEQLTRWLEKSQAEELRLRAAHYEEKQRAEGLSARARTLQADNDRLQDEAQRWEAAYRERGSLISTQQDSVLHLLGRLIAQSEQFEASKEPCVWRHDPGGVWLTGCGSVADRYAPFCPFCGHKTEKLKTSQKDH